MWKTQKHMNQKIELSRGDLETINGGGEWAGIGYLWSGGGAAFGVVAGVAAAFAVAPAIVGVAIIAGAAFGAAGGMVLIADGM